MTTQSSQIASHNEELPDPDQNIHVALLHLYTLLQGDRKRLYYARSKEARFTTLLARLQLDRESVGDGWEPFLRSNGVFVKKGREIGNPELEVLREESAEARGQWWVMVQKVVDLERRIKGLNEEVEKLQDARGGDDEYETLQEFFRKGIQEVSFL